MSEYFIGLDIGTESVGWAVTDPQYKIIKKAGKALWGVRLFSEAEKAADRRMHRTARRRYERRNQRIAWLRELFSAEIAKVDPAFFQRMDESKYLEQDKYAFADGTPLGRYTLFADKNYCDRDFHREFPTIYHLRKALMCEDRAFDVRLVYLALHHILKKRGHFLFQDVRIEDVTFESCWQELNDYLQNECEDTCFTLADPAAFAAALTDRSLNITRKKAALKKAADIPRDAEQLHAIIDLLAGAKIKVSALTRIGYSRDEDISFSFKSNFDSDEPKLIDLLGDDMQLVYLTKKLYDWSVLDALKNGESYISYAKVKVYQQHDADLESLKSLLRPHREAFREMFNVSRSGLDNYAAYSGHKSAHSCNYDKFSAYAKKQIKALLPAMDAGQHQKAERILSALELGIFLPKQTNSDNGVIPHQLHEQELNIILQRASRYLPFLNEKDESGLTRREQILEVFRFRIPYYVGPLYKIKDKDKAKNQNCWVVRTDEKITPWNFEKVVDLPASAENFITRMTATCSYIGAPVVPKDSLLYNKFVALNMINKLRINGHPISVETKQRVFNDHLMVKYKSSMKLLKDYLLSSGLLQKGDELSGVDDQFKLTLTGYQVFRQILSRGGSESMVEDIIRHIVLFGDDRKLLSGWLARSYGSILSSDDQDYILKNRGRFSGWGNLSSQFLTKIEHTDPNTDEASSIISALWNTNHNLTELLSSEFTFTQAIDAYRNEAFGSKKRTLDEVLKDSYASPGIRRAIHQSIGIISEIEKIMGDTPKRVFVEVTRGEGEKARVPSRKRKLDELYAFCKSEAPEVYDQLQDEDEASLRSTKLYLYYTQMGRCMYSGEPIDLDRLSVDYDIDHIYPQSVVKDDSLDNRVLVKKELNAAKSDRYPILEDIRAKMRPSLWSMLRKKNLISEEKYRRLTRSTPFADSERSGFIARQLVETSQSAKIVAELLKNRYGDNDRVVYVKAGNVSLFRQDQRVLPDGTQRQAWECKNQRTAQDPLFVKCRDVNDFHHARDAYLNIVVGNVYHTKFTRDPLSFIRSGQKYSLNCIFDRDVTRSGECAWKTGDDGTIRTVRQMMGKNNILFTRYAHEAGGQLFDLTLMPRGNGQAAIKSSDPRMSIEKYGGYNKLTGAYFMLVEHTEKKKRVRSIETVFLMHKALYERDRIGYCETVLGLKDPKILIPKILIDALVSYDGFRMHVVSRSNDNIFYNNANQLVIAPEWQQYIKMIGKYKDSNLPNQSLSKERNLLLYDLLLDKLANTLYSIQYNTPVKHLSNQRNCFIEQDLLTQCEVILEILNLFKNASCTADLKKIGGKKTGQVSVTKRITSVKCEKFILIHQSITGFFEKEVDLLGDKF